jgi:hypothetical protein
VCAVAMTVSLQLAHTSTQCPDQAPGG